MRNFFLGVAALALAACQPAVPDSAAGAVDPGQGVGFQDYERYQASREAELTGRTAIPGPVAVDSSPLPAGRDPARDAAERSGITPMGADAPADEGEQDGGLGPAPQVVTTGAGISAEQDFDAVSGQRDIQQDAALIARNRAQYELVQPTQLPTRPGSDRPNIVEYALRTDHPVGTPLYRRSGFRAEARSRRACAEYTSNDFAQEDFLARGGPQRDRLGVDPDGDGFACGWDPTPFRAVRGG